MTSHRHDHAGLTKNQSLVLEALTRSNGPLSAYTILDHLRDEGFRAPLQVYRALDKLVEFGMVHKLESLNSFVACTHPECTSHETVAFTICDTCGDVAELASDKLIKDLQSIAHQQKFALAKSTVELRGTCHGCHLAASQATN